ncbi:hypothetical protein LZZ85_21540 [Terrimonas sp. NA20]|uniref:Uncharacterized protein n=1 Tax=Terrimonas ginsenosidimutans TaxID=2908004 RepID=A0ABS9KX52_9BACT|nr:hypothetical protein [Terrimonas ginsenosidimutans]MCG2616895.1 hypothetical protein [Terrimonas ginsenosidimutans]
MHLQFKPVPLIAFFILVLVLHEAHESAHYFAAWLFCGCPGDRDFLVWRVCRTCTEKSPYLLASFAGPLVTNLFMWIGFYLMRPSAALKQKTIGFALAIAALPLPRWLAAIDKGGDEIFTLRQVFTTHQYIAVLVGGFLVLAFTIPPVWRAMKLIRNKYSLLILAAFLAIPWVLDRLLIEKYFNGKLAASGLWMEPVYAGVPTIVVGWQIIILAALIMSCRYLKDLSVNTAFNR